MSNYAKRPRRLLAGMLAGALALSVTPILGFTGVASAQEVAEPTGPGNFCEDVPQQEPFTDVQTTDPSYAEIVCLVATEITTGVTATTYEPNSFVTRRQMALFLVRLANEANRLEIGDSINELPAPADTDFSDTEDEEQFIEDAISQITQANVAEGFPDNTYRPNAPVSRRQMAAFIDRMYEFLTGTALPNSATDHFADDNADSAEAQESTNAVAEAGIFIGNEDGTFRPAQEITRRQMANVLTRTLQVLFENGEITKWADDDAGPGNQTFTVAGTTEGRNLGPDGARTCIVSGLASGGTYDVALFPSEDVRIAADGSVTFTDADGSANQADNEGNTLANIVNINGTPTSGADEQNNVVAPTGLLSVTLASFAADDVTLVVWRDQDGFTPNTLDLVVPGIANNNPKAPREAFGIGCRTLFANEAAGGAFGPVVVQSTDKASNLFTAGGNNYFYDANDTYQISGVPQAAGEAGMAAFEARLSPGDTVQGTYATDPAGVSTFNLTDDAPAAPASSDTVGSSGTTVVLNYAESTTPTADSYNIYRIVRPAGAVACPDFNTGGGTGRGLYPATPTATQPDPTPSAAGATTRTFTDTGLAANTTYCYAVTTVDEGDESATATQEEVTTSTVGTAPTIQDVRARDAGTIGVVDTGDLHQFIFSEPMNATIDDAGSLYRIQDADGTVSEIVCGTNAVCVLQGAGTYNGTAYPAGQVLRVTVSAPVAPIAGFLGTNPGQQYPTTITNVSATWDDAGGAQLDLAGSPDKLINVDTITPNP